MKQIKNIVMNKSHLQCFKSIKIYLLFLAAAIPIPRNVSMYYTHTRTQDVRDKLTAAQVI